MMSVENEEYLIQRYTNEGRKVLREGLLISNTITLDSWAEIFSDDPLAGQQIHGARDDSYWGRREEERPRPAAGDDNDDDPFDEILISQPAVNSQDPEQAMISSGEEGDLGRGE
ncbi:hypothetical protein H9Q72_014492, partial [Fusarium xylarioides]